MTVLASLLIDSKELGSGTHFSHALGASSYYRLIFISVSCLLTLQKPLGKLLPVASFTSFWSPYLILPLGTTGRKIMV